MTDTRRQLVGATDYSYPDGPTRYIFETGYFDEPLQNQEEKVIDLGKFIIQAQPKHADDLIGYGMTIPGEIFVYVPSPDKPIDDDNPLCFVSEDKASEFSSWPEGVSRTCFFPVYNWVSLQLPGIMACSEVVCTISQPSLDEPSGDKVHTQLPEQQFEREFVRRLYRVSAQYPAFGCTETTSDVTGCNDPSLDEPSLEEPSLDSSKEINIKSLDKYLLDLQSDMLHLSEAIVAALECLRESSEENNDIFIKAYNKYRSKRGQTVLGEE